MTAEGPHASSMARPTANGHRKANLMSATISSRESSTSTLTTSLPATSKPATARTTATATAKPPREPLHLRRPFLTLTVVFVLFRSILLLVALGTNYFDDYDTSTSLFTAVVYGPRATVPELAHRLLRWDSLYFIHVVREGYVFEQEWAFLLGFPTTVREVLRGLRFLGLVGTDESFAVEPLVGIAIAHVSHWAAVMALYVLTKTLTGGDKTRAWVASLVHVVSPAGMFLSAPYAESTFAMLCFVGYVLFARSYQYEGRGQWAGRGAMLVGAGALFGLATTFRSNGILNGLLFAVEAVVGLAKWWARPSWAAFAMLIPVVVGGACVAVGAAGPPVIAYMRYCVGSDDPRPWCSHFPPNIYPYVQGIYWDVGFLHYWSKNQISMFLLATPVLLMLIPSGIDTLREPSRALSTLAIPPSSTAPALNGNAKKSKHGESNGKVATAAPERQVVAPSTLTACDREKFRFMVRLMAFQQTMLSMLAITNYHVQIINRISTGYPVWYWWVAACFADRKRLKWGWPILMYVIMYGMVQGGLFASFLPPA